MPAENLVRELTADLLDGATDARVSTFVALLDAITREGRDGEDMRRLARPCWIENSEAARLCYDTRRLGDTIMSTYETEAAWAHIIDQTGASYEQASEFLTAMSDYYRPQTSKPKDDRLSVEVEPAEYDFNKVLIFVFQTTDLPLWMIAAMMTADVSYMASIGILPAQAAEDIKKWEAFHFDSLASEEPETIN